MKLPHREAHHIFKVLRGRKGDAIEVVDAGRRLFLARLLGENEVEVVEGVKGGGHHRGFVRIYQAVPKGSHMDLLVEKATELGADEIVPLVSARVVVGVEAIRRKLSRWRKVAESAARQSLQLRIPEVREPVSFEEALRETDGWGVLLHNEGGLAPIEEPVAQKKEVGLLVGPEGGWSKTEIETARVSGVPLASLGPYRLRSETAGVVAVARARAALDNAGKERYEQDCEV